MSVVLDNNKIGAVGEYVKENTKDGSIITISSPIFTIYAFEELRKVIKEYRIKRIILGMPQSFGSTDTRAQDKIISFKNMLENSINLPVILFDESFSTKNAQDMLISSGMHSKSFRHKIDSIACALFLQEFLNFEQKNK